MTFKKLKEQSKKEESEPAPSIAQEVKKESDEIAKGSSDVLRSLTVIYGFFFVFMSAMVAGAQNLRINLDITNVLLFYFFIVTLAIACFLIGLEIYKILRGLYISNIGDWGVLLLILLVPMIFVFAIGQAILVDIIIFGANLVPFGVSVISWTELLITGLIAWRNRKDEK